MRVRKITSLQRRLCYLLFLLSTTGFSQTVPAAPAGIHPTPWVVTQRSSITITGTGFTANSTVRFYTSTANATTSTAHVPATSVTYVSPTEIRAIVPLVLAAGTASTQLTFRVVTGSTFTEPYTYYYVAPRNYASTSGITEVVTNWNNGTQTFWKSTSASSVANQQPDGAHSVMGFRYQGKMYSTGSESGITTVLGAAGYTTAGTTGTGTGYIAGNFRALPIKNILGTVPNSGPNLIVLGSRIDGSTTTQVPTAPNVVGLSVRDVLIDGTRGLNIGTGVANLPSTAVLNFEATNIVANGVSDGVPDIIVSQIAEPTDGSASVYSFTDINGNVVGYPVQVVFSSAQVPVIGRYKSDFFTLPVGQPLSTAQINGSLLIGAATRDIRMVAYKIGDFGIDTSNFSEPKYFKVMPSGTSDPAFMAYNRNRFLIPAPEITGQPSSQALCPGGGAQFQVTVAALSSGTETPTYQWEKNGVPLVNGGNIQNADTATLTISPVTAADAGAYRCLITNASGAALSNNAYLNTIITAGPDVAACTNGSAIMEVSSLGNNPTYQWYKNTTNSNVGGTAVPSNTYNSVTYTGTGANYAPPAGLTAGPHYYYVVSRPAGLTCAEADVRSSVMQYTVASAAQGGSITPDQSVCPGGYASVTVSEYNGTIQWQSSANNADWTDISTSTTITATTPTLYIASVSATTYYRAKITASCGSGGSTVAYSPVSKISVNDSYIWTGLVNTDWSNAGNWSCNTVPTLTTIVTIPVGAPHYPHVYGLEGKAKTVTVEDGAAVTVDVAGTLRVADGITVLGGEDSFVVENNGALIQNNSASNIGNITVKRNSNALYRLDYSLWSSPVANQNLQAFSTATNADRFYEYRYGTTTVSPIQTTELYWGVNAASTQFAPARSYLIRMPNIDATPNYNSGTATLVFPGQFKGMPNNGNIQPPINLGPAATANQAGHYYAAGNPYPSPISVYDFFNDTDNQSRIQAGSALYFWRKKNDALVSSYATLTLSGFTANNVANQPNQGGQNNASFYPTSPATANQQWIISPGQGFLVKLAAGITQNVVFKNSMRRAAPANAATAGQPFFRTLNNTSVPSRYWINLADVTGSYSQALVAYSEEGTLGVDYGYDGLEFAQGPIRFYSKQAGNNFTIQARPQFEATDVVPMGFTITAAGQYSISLHDKDGVFADGQVIYVKDNMLGTMYNLANGAYTFTTDAGSFADRFEIVYMNSMLGTPDFDLNNVYVYKQNGTNTININSGSLELTGVKVFDIRGRELYSVTATGNTAAVNLNMAQQVIIVEVATTAGTVTRKIIF